MATTVRASRYTRLYIASTAMLAMLCLITFAALVSRGVIAAPASTGQQDPTCKIMEPERREVAVPFNGKQDVPNSCVIINAAASTTCSGTTYTYSFGFDMGTCTTAQASGTIRLYVSPSQSGPWTMQAQQSFAQTFNTGRNYVTGSFTEVIAPPENLWYYVQLTGQLVSGPYTYTLSNSTTATPLCQGPFPTYTWTPTSTPSTPTSTTTPTVDPAYAILRYVQTAHPSWVCQGPFGTPGHLYLQNCYTFQFGTHPARAYVDDYDVPQAAEAEWQRRRLFAISVYPIFFDFNYSGHPGYQAGNESWPYGHLENYFWGERWVMGATSQDDTPYNRGAGPVASAVAQAAFALGYLTPLSTTPTPTPTYNRTLTPPTITATSTADPTGTPTVTRTATRTATACLGGSPLCHETPTVAGNSPTATSTTTSTATRTNSPTVTRTPTGTPTLPGHGVCSVQFSSSAATCSLPANYSYVYNFYVYSSLQDHPCPSVYGSGTIYLEVAESSGGPWIIEDQQTYARTFYLGYNTIQATFDGTGIPSQYGWYRVRIVGYIGSYNPASTTTPAPICVASPPCTLSFTDVPEGSTFYPFIRCLACRGIISGYSDGTFRPGNDVTRGQLSKIVANAAGFHEPVSGQTFSDVLPTHTFYEFVERMASRGIVSGYSDGTFRPGNPATRGQIAKIVANAANFNEPVSGQTFTDVPPIHTFYEFIERMASRGIIGGYSDGTFRPQNNATRGQVSKIVANSFYPNCQSP